MLKITSSRLGIRKNWTVVAKTIAILLDILRTHLDSISFSVRWDQASTFNGNLHARNQLRTSLGNLLHSLAKLHPASRLIIVFARS